MAGERTIGILGSAHSLFGILSIAFIKIRALERQRVEDADNALTDDLFGGVDTTTSRASIKLVPARSVIQLDEKKCHQCY